jgi:protein farnesyltransferase/geranylgeranyltransferase type-1 subunit alpha
MAFSTAMITTEDLPTLFHDVTPLPQDEGPHIICRIDYPLEFTIAYDYFRAVSHKDEWSERALQLTTLCLQFNPANYTVWHFRRKCMWALLMKDDKSIDLEAFLVNDLTLAAALGGENPKNYQIWYHRRAILEYVQHQTNSKELFYLFCRRELDYTAEVFQEDSKNYHAWCFRQWILQTMKDPATWREEMDFSHQMIMDGDVRNNSAWNQRWLAAHRGQLTTPLALEMAQSEADYALQGARIDPYNECPWRYLIAILKEHCRNSTMEEEKRTRLLQHYLDQAQLVKEVLKEADKDPEACPNLSAALVDLLEMKGDAEALTHAKQLVHYLEHDIDPIRARYWAFRSKTIEETIASKSD